MHTLKSTLAPLALSAVGWLLISTAAAAASMHVEFSGTFSHCLVNFIGPGSCAGMAFSSLDNTDFHGSLETPHNRVDLEPSVPTRGLYQFDQPAFMSVTTADPQFNVSDATPVTMPVNNCARLGCAFNEDYVWTWVERGGFDYLFSLYLPHPPIDSDAVPSVQRMMDFYPMFELLTPSAALEVTIDTSNFLVSSLTVSFSSVPAPAAVLGMLSALGALVLAGAGRRKRKMD